MKKLIFLGTGSAMVTHCFNTCFLLQLAEGDYFLTDAGGGNGILRQLELAGLEYQRLHHLFVTHGHTDHVLGVIWVIRKIATLMNQGKYDGEFHIYCHDVVANILTTTAGLVLKKKDLAQIGKRIFIHELKDGDRRIFLGMELTAFDILSTKAKQFGYQLRFDDGMIFTCLGDEPYNEHCRQYAEKADWLLSEAFCLYRDREIFKPYEKHHSTVKEASELAEHMQVKNLVLYHTEDKNMPERKVHYTAEAKEYYHGNVFVPEDLETIPLA